MQLIKILTRILKSTKLAILGKLLKILMQLVPASSIKYLAVWVPLFAILLQYLKIFNFVLGCMFLIGLMDLNNISLDEIINTFVRAKNFIIVQFLAIIDFLFRTHYSGGRPTIDINIDNADRDMFTAPSVLEDMERDFTQVQSPNDVPKSSWSTSDYFKAAAGIVILALFGYIIYQNYDDIKKTLSGGDNAGSASGGSSSSSSTRKFN